MRFADQPEIPADSEAQSPDADFVANDDNQPPSELAA
jgi:ParB family chromosome partitioning protein